jgi:hypothetical protein
MGELMRRYWHPIAASGELDTNPFRTNSRRPRRAGTQAPVSGNTWNQGAAANTAVGTVPVL